MAKFNKEEFLSHVADHEIKVLNSNGVYRHLHFGKPGHVECSFQLTTFPGHLVITGDMGDLVFRRTEDMFKFFRRDELSVNTGYWSEKLQAGEFESFDSESVEKSLKQWLEDKIDSFKYECEDEYSDEFKELKDNDISLKDLDKLFDSLREDLEYQIENTFDLNSKDSARESILDIEVNSNEFDFYFKLEDWDDVCDISESGIEYSYKFQWLCYAIVWGIQKFDKEVI